LSADPPARSPRPHWIVWLFAAVGFLGFLAIIALAVTVLGEDRPYRPAQVAGEHKEVVFTLGDPQDLAGTNLMSLDVDASAGRGGSSPYSRGEEDRRNILLLDKATGASRRILPDNLRRIRTARFLPAKTSIRTGTEAMDDALLGDKATDEGSPAAYYLLEIDQGTGSEARDVLAGTLADGRQGIVMRGIDGIDSVWMQSPTRFGLIVRERLGLFYRIVDIPSLKVVQSRRIEVG